MSRPASIVRHYDITRAEKALRARGLSIGKLTIFPDRVEIVPISQDAVDNPPLDQNELPEPKL